MDCYKCHYKGKPEFGEFTSAEVPWNYHMRCPKCGYTMGTFHELDSIESAIRFPHLCYGPENPHQKEPRKQVVMLNENSFSIHCPLCGFGYGGGAGGEDFRKGLKALRELQLELAKS